MAKRYYWLKLKEDFFSQPRIKKLRKVAGGDTYTLIYLKMQLLSLKNNGILAFEGIEEDFAEEIALTIDEDADNVRFTLLYLTNQGLMQEVEEGEFAMIETMQSIGSETAGAERVRRHREQKKALQCNTAVTSCNTEKEIEIDKEREIEIENCSVDGGKPPAAAAPVPYSQIRDLYHEICGSYPKLRSISENRKKAIAARWKEYDRDIETFRKLFELAEASPFLKGKNQRNWSADFDWLMNSANMAKVLEGKYDDEKGGPGNGTNRTNSSRDNTKRPVLTGFVMAEDISWDESELDE